MILNKLISLNYDCLTILLNKNHHHHNPCRSDTARNAAEEVMNSADGSCCVNYRTLLLAILLNSRRP